ncbi:MAG: urease subunit alpha, partial [Thermoleophilaceae bacterium]|nr:urease subunit alpha [Thermoleophilaceae bacterium]
QASEAWPINFGFLGKGSAYDVAPLLEQGRAGAVGLKIHEDWGAMPAVIESSLDAGDELDMQVQIHTDTLNESGFYEHTMRTIGERTIHTYHSEGAWRERPTACRRPPTPRTRRRSTRSTSTWTW